MTKQEIGILGEEAAVNLLIDKGYTILERNWRIGHNEIDIIAIFNNILVFVEVKTRDENYLYAPETAVNSRKKNNVMHAARRYIGIKNRTEESRLDVITVLHKKGKITSVSHIESAFYPKVRRF